MQLALMIVCGPLRPRHEAPSVAGCDAGTDGGADCRVCAAAKASVGQALHGHTRLNRCSVAHVREVKFVRVFVFLAHACGSELLLLQLRDSLREILTSFS